MRIGQKYIQILRINLPNPDQKNEASCSLKYVIFVFMTPQSITQEVLSTNGNIVFLTGAGLSAASGIPTFRGPEGYWTIGSANYMPTEMATQRMFQKHPEEVWDWYLYRFGICGKSDPNEGHYAIVKMEEMLQDRFVLVSQNIDGLHQKAGNSLERSYYIHGNAAYMRCSKPCHKRLIKMPHTLWYDGKQEMNEKTKKQLTCPNCGSWMRPHVLWFDESYNEHYYSYETVLEKSSHADLLFVIGTSGATTLPNYVVQLAIQTGAFVIEINPNDTQFTDVIGSYSNGMIQRKEASDALSDWVQLFNQT